MPKIIVTGAAGFIASQLIAGLNQQGYTDILAVDNLTHADQFRNLVNLQIADYMDVDEFYPRLSQNAHHWLGDADVVFHQGACSDTLCQDGRFMLKNNYTDSKVLWQTCQQVGIRMIYASSAAVYGGSHAFVEDPAYERPLNVYGYSKLLFDNYLRGQLGMCFERASPQTVGLRYFNVYGPGEFHKGRMASVPFHQFGQFQTKGKVGLFGGHAGYQPGEQQRDFISVEDVVKVNLWLLDHPNQNGLFNLGTGRAQTFNEVACAVLHHFLPEQQGLRMPQTWVQTGQLEYVDFPSALVGKYQSYTQADMTKLRQAGYVDAFDDVQTGVIRYMNYLEKNQGLFAASAPVR
jgi:ADP-L-glycero-D-manno-heptose 6-epimerase